MHLEPVPKISKRRRKPLEADLGSERDLDRKKYKITFRDVGLEVNLPSGRAWFYLAWRYHWKASSTSRKQCFLISKDLVLFKSMNAL